MRQVMLVNIHFSKYHIWKGEELTNTSTCNIFGFTESSYSLNSGIYAVNSSQKLNKFNQCI